MREGGDYQLCQVGFGCNGRSETGATFGGFDNRFSDCGMGVAEDQRAPGAYIVDVLVAVHIHDAGALAKGDERRISTYGTEGADRGIYSSGDELLGSLL